MPARRPIDVRVREKFARLKRLRLQRLAGIVPRAAVREYVQRFPPGQDAIPFPLRPKR